MDLSSVSLPIDDILGCASVLVGGLAAHFGIRHALRVIRDSTEPHKYHKRTLDELVAGDKAFFHEMSPKWGRKRARQERRAQIRRTKRNYANGLYF